MIASQHPPKICLCSIRKVLPGMFLCKPNKNSAFERSNYQWKIYHDKYEYEDASIHHCYRFLYLCRRINKQEMNKIFMAGKNHSQTILIVSLLYSLSLYQLLCMRLRCHFECIYSSHERILPINFKLPAPGASLR